MRGHLGPRSEPLRRRLALVVVAASGFALLVAAVLALRWTFAYPDRPLQGPSKPMELVVAEGATFGTVLEDLRKRGVVRRPFLFRMFANSSGMAGKLRPGTYTIRPGMTPRQILTMMVKGPPVVLRRVTVPEGEHLVVAPGHYYVNGIRCENREETSLLIPDEPNVHLLYLDVWERHIAAVEEDLIREVALNGPDTGNREARTCD